MGNLKGYKHYFIYILLAGVIVLLLCRREQGRYALSPLADGSGAYVLDTKTSQVWVRGPGISIYFGTNENPQMKKVTENN
jgi:hypothetical protein